MKKNIMSLFVALALMCSMTTAFAANTSSEGKHYYMDLESMTEQEFKDSSVVLQFFINGQMYYLKTDGETVKPDGTVVDESDLGNALLFDYRPNGKLDQDSMPVTFVPIRRVANALGLSISWNDETKNVVLDTPKGRIEFPVGATSITAPDGTTYEEQTYRFPNGDPINITSVRNGRVYVTVRFISTFCMPDATYQWKGTSRLTVMGVMDGTTVQKTYGLNKNYLSSDGLVNWPTLPNFNAAVEAAGKSYKFDFGEPEIYLLPADDGMALQISKYAGRDELKIGNIDCTENYAVHLPIIQGLLQDMVCDEDATAIMALLNEQVKNLSPGYSLETGATQEAINWWNSQPRTHLLKEVNLRFDDSGDMTISPK